MRFLLCLQLGVEPNQNSRLYPPTEILLALMPGVVLTLLGILLFSSTGRDDSHITYWPAYSLSHFGEILNYNGQRIEQSSSLLQVLILALAAKLSGMRVTSLGTPFSVLFGASSAAATYQLARRIDYKAAFPAAILTGTSAWFIYWSFGGLESTLFSFSLLILILADANYLCAADRGGWVLFWPVLSLVLFALVRPESPIVLICALLLGIAIVCVKRRGLKRNGSDTSLDLLHRMIILAGISALFTILLFLFRDWYFGSIFPQPVIAKSVGLSWTSYSAGVGYFRDQLLQNRAIEIISLVSAMGAGFFAWNQLRAEHLDPYALLSLVFLITYLFFILFSGGDWMEGGRFFVHILPIAVMFIPLSLLRLTQSKLIVSIVLIVLLAIQGRALLTFASNWSTGIPIWSDIYVPHGYDLSQFSWFERHNRINMRDVPTIQYLDGLVSQLLRQRKDRLLVILSGQMGTVPFHISTRYFRQVQFLDLHGLIESTFTTCKSTKDLPRTQVGVALGYRFYFQEVKDKEKDCGIQPDIIFDLTEEVSATELETHGYRVVFSQTGFVGRTDRLLPGGGNWPAGLPIPANQFVALRSDLLSGLAAIDSTQVDFGDIQ
jgi:hypothetical protein